MANKKLMTDVGSFTYTRLHHDPESRKFYQEHRHIGNKGKFSEITKDDVLRKLTMAPHPMEDRRQLHEKNLKKYVPEYESHRLAREAETRKAMGEGKEYGEK